MRLENERRYTYDQCFACIHSGEKDSIIFPREYRGKNMGEQYIFDIYYKTTDDPDAMYHGARKKSAGFCALHAIELYQEWVLVAQQEVDLSRQYNNWIDRVDSEREDLYGG
jgi:hypothetical protein